AARHSEGRRGARDGAGEDGLDYAAHEVQGRGLRSVEGRGWQAYSVLQRLSSAVLLPDDGRDGVGETAGRHGDGDAGRQHRSGGGAAYSGGDGEGPQVRDPRRRQDSGRRDDYGDSAVTD